MYDSKIRYLASAFVDAESIVPNANQALELLKAFGSDKFLPAIINELSPSGQKSRLGFRTLDGASQIILSSMRFDFASLATTADGSNLGEFSDFCKQAKIFLTTALKFFQRKAHRLAAVQEGLLQIMSSQEMHDIAQRLLRFPDIYEKFTPFEWDWRVVSIVEREFSGIKEPTNTITAVKRIPSYAIQFGGEQPTQTSEDRIRIDFDINTLPINTIARFDEQQIHDFFDQAPTWHGELSSEVFSFVFGK
jgi:hypothetical protein